jgi:hypothetical protein
MSIILYTIPFITGRFEVHYASLHCLLNCPQKYTLFKLFEGLAKRTYVIVFLAFFFSFMIYIYGGVVNSTRTKTIAIGEQCNERLSCGVQEESDFD